MMPYLHRVEMSFRSTLVLPDVPIHNVYFPESGWASLLVPLEDGDAAEVGLIGREGMIGLPLLFGVDRSITEALVQGAGTALAMEAGAFRRVLAENSALRDLLMRYAFALNTQLTMTAACNGRHLLEERLARWLLMSHDRVDGDEFPMTHEFLSMMLGVRRAGVTVAAGSLQKAGLIRYEQGRIQVMDRPGLENAACECHRVVTHEFRRVLGKPAV
jgi:CRP-like cAMP-binding protein